MARLTTEQQKKNLRCKLRRSRDSLFSIPDRFAFAIFLLYTLNLPMPSANGKLGRTPTY